MSNMTITEFNALLTRDDWEVEYWYKKKRYHTSWNTIAYFGWASKTSTLKGIEIAYFENFHYYEGLPDSLYSGNEEIGMGFILDGVPVFENGKEVRRINLASRIPYRFKEIDYCSIIDFGSRIWNRKDVHNKGKEAKLIDCIPF